MKKLYFLAVLCLWNTGCAHMREEPDTAAASSLGKSVLNEVRSFYLESNKTYSCIPGVDSEPDKGVIGRVLNPEGYEVEVDYFSQWLINVSLYNPTTNDLIGIAVRIEAGRCKEFTISQGYSCKT